KGGSDMRLLAKLSSTAAMIAAVAILATSVGPKHVAAQQKNPLAPDLVRNVDEPGFNPYQASVNIFLTNFSGDASLPIPTGKVPSSSRFPPAALSSPRGLYRYSFAAETARRK